MRILVTGGYGLLGRQIVAMLAADGHQVLLTSRHARDERRPGITCWHLELTADDSWPVLPVDVEAVVHAAARVSTQRNRPADVEPFWRANVLGTLRVAQWVAEPQVHTFIYCSSTSVYAQNPDHALTESSPTYPSGDDWVYGLSKLGGELCVLRTAPAHQRTFVLRFAPLYGPGMLASRAIAKFLDQARRGEILRVNGASATSDFLYAKDAAAAVRNVLPSEMPGGIYNIASGVETSLVEAALAAWEVAAPGTRSNISTFDSASGTRFRVDIARARRHLNFAPRFTLREGLVDWMREAPSE